MELLKTRRSRKLNNQYRHVYMNMMQGKKEASVGGWVSIYNRMIKDLLLDLQDSGAFPSNGYLQEQMSQIKDQAIRIHKTESSDDGEEVKWDRLISAVQDSDIFWDNEFHVESRDYITKCFALINEHGLNNSELVTIQSTLGGSLLKDHGVIHVKCASLIRRNPLRDEDQPKYEHIIKKLLLDYVEAEMKSLGESTMLLEDKRSFSEKVYDWYLMKRL